MNYTPLNRAVSIVGYYSVLRQLLPSVIYQVQKSHDNIQPLSNHTQHFLDSQPHRTFAHYKYDYPIPLSLRSVLPTALSFDQISLCHCSSKSSW